MERPPASPSFRFLLLGSLLLAGCAATSSTRGGAAPTPVTGFDNDDGVFFYSAGVDAILTDEKDAGLLNAMHLLDDRLVELPEELGEGDVPRDAIELPVRALLGPMSLRLAYRGMDVAARGEAPVHLQFNSTQADTEAAGDFAGRVAALLSSDLPPGEVGADGLTHIQLGGPMAVSHGAQGADFVVGVGGVESEPLKLGGLGLPAGVATALAFKMDFGQYLSALEDFSAMMGPDGAEMMGFLEMFGLKDLEVQTAVGIGPDRTYTTTFMPGYANALPAKYAGDEVLARATLEMIPADAVWASASVIDFSALLKMIVGALGQVPDVQQELGDANPLDVIEQLTGIHPAHDIFDHLGSQWGMYMADSTGGGGLGSLVVFSDVRDADALRATLARIGGMANGAAEQYAEGYIQVRDWTLDGHEYTSLTFPGLPVPLEITYTFEGPWFIKGLTPQAVIAGVEQARGGKPSLADSKAFRSMVTGSLDDLFAVSFLNTPALLSDGYGWASFLSSALANGVRSRTDASRDAGLIVPPLQVLAAGAKPTVSVSRMVGDDLVVTGQSDRSTVVNLTGMAGLVGRIPALLVVPAAIGAAAGFAAETHSGAPLTYEAF